MVISVTIQMRGGFLQTIYMTIFNPSSRVNLSLNKVTRQELLTQLDYFFHVNAYKHLTMEGLPFAVIQPRSSLALNFRLCMLLKSAISTQQLNDALHCMWRTIQETTPTSFAVYELTI